MSSDETPLARRRSRLSRMRRGRFERPTNPLVAPCVPDSAWADAWQAEPTRNADNSNEPIAPGVREGGKKLWCEYSAPTATGLFEGGEQQDGELPWACLGEKQQPFFNPAVIDTRSSGPNPQHHPPNPSDFSRQILTAVDIASVAACAVMTATMLNFSQDPGEHRHPNLRPQTITDAPPGRTCPSPSADPRWAAALPLVPQLPEVLRCPDPTTYVLALSVYSVVGMVQVALEPKYWADCGLVAALAALGAGGAYGPRCMVDVLILGGFLSLVCSKVLGWYGNNRRGERAAGRN